MFRRTGVGVVAACLVLLVSAPACAQNPTELAAMRKEIETLKAGQAELRKDLDEIKNLLKPAPSQAIMDAPPGLTVPLAGAPSRGSATAPLVVLEFSDYECPYCARFVRDSYPAIDRDYIATGKVRHVFRAFPLVSIHKNATKAHEAAYCAGDQQKYWDMHHQLFQHQRALSPADLAGYAKTVGLDVAAFSACLSQGTHAARVQADMAAGNQIGIQGTPLFLIGRVGPNGELQVLKGINGAHPADVFKQAFDDLLAAK